VVIVLYKGVHAGMLLGLARLPQQKTNRWGRGHAVHSATDGVGVSPIRSGWGRAIRYTPRRSSLLRGAAAIPYAYTLN